MGVSNLVVMSGIVIFYAFILWGINGLYEETGDYGVDITGEYSLEDTSMTGNLFGVGTYQDDRIPPVINLLVITPMNFLLVGCLFYFLRSGAS